MVKAHNKINKQSIYKAFAYIIGLFIASIAYNFIFVPNNIVIGGVSGLAVALKEITGTSTTILIDIMNVFLVILAFIFLAKKDAMKQIIGCICYPIMITLTSKLNLSFPINDITLKLLFGALMYGVSLGVIYRAGLSTGGFDIIAQIISNKIKKPITIISPIINTLVLFVGYIVFNPIQIIYSLIIIFISNRIINAVLFSICNNKMVYIMSNDESITSYITEKFHLGVTEFKINKELVKRKKRALLVIVHNTMYDAFKKSLLNEDPHATIITKKCYEVTGGSRFRILPF